MCDTRDQEWQKLLRDQARNVRCGPIGTENWKKWSVAELLEWLADRGPNPAATAAP